ncbi:uncharacterized protein EV422DRAFT_531470 [Fimicolochytrium jonesii]|uniref:uncharacterized protein n=1 Tax=Fimicolochytrium jonesii TaxID=1396493 RepID=UPI0022FEE3D4|nr:uncharacterized protein EV422DRAFT_531470 [Fimicolochytrium jonesii]KAI8820585.1 hypothetical protein EV422DRAFT_531470 [Fimicolochytrium jonesii]
MHRLSSEQLRLTHRHALRLHLHLRPLNLHRHAMSPSHHTITLNNKQVPLTRLPTATHIDLEAVQQFQPFQAWTAAMSRELAGDPESSHRRSSSPSRGDATTNAHVGDHVHVRGVEVTDVDTFGSGKIGFVKFRADVVWKDGDDAHPPAANADDGWKKEAKIPGIVFARGGAVAILVLVRPEGSDKNNNSDDKTTEEDEERVVLVLQPRIPIASLSFAELPAGMLDGDNKFAGTAARELEEECGIRIHEDELVDLSALPYTSNSGNHISDADDLRTAGIFPSPGGSDEFIKIYLARKTLSRDDITRLEGREGGLRASGERITVRLVRLSELWRATRDMKAFVALSLYERGRREGLV